LSEFIEFALFLVQFASFDASPAVQASANDRRLKPIGGQLSMGATYFS